MDARGVGAGVIPTGIGQAMPYADAAHPQQAALLAAEQARIEAQARKRNATAKLRAASAPARHGAPSSAKSQKAGGSQPRSASREAAAGEYDFVVPMGKGASAPRDALWTMDMNNAATGPGDPADVQRRLLGPSTRERITSFAALPNATRKAEGRRRDAFQRAAARQAKGTGNLNAAKAGVDDMQALTYAGIEAIGEAGGWDSIATKGKEGRERNVKEAAQYGQPMSLDDVDSVISALRYGTEGLARLAPSLIGGVAATTAGAIAAPAVGGSAMVGGALAGGALAITQGIGAVQSAAKEKDPNSRAGIGTIAGGTAIGLLDTVLPGKIGGKLVERFGIEAAEKIATHSLTRIAALRRAGATIAKDGMIAGATAAVQQAIQEVAAGHASGKGIDWQKAPGEVVKAAIAGGGGGVAGAGVRRLGRDGSTTTAARPGLPDPHSARAWIDPETGQLEVEIRPDAPTARAGSTTGPDDQAAGPRQDALDASAGFGVEPDPESQSWDIEQVDGLASPDEDFEYPEGSFSIIDWTGYPEGVERPKGVFRLLVGEEYKVARKAANSANRSIRRIQKLVGIPVDVHEIQPVKFGGDTGPGANKVVLDRALHRKQVTPWWNELQRHLERQGLGR
jgi:hypothetical protein